MRFEEWRAAWQKANPCKNPGDIAFYFTSQDVWNASRAEAFKEAAAIARADEGLGDSVCTCGGRIARAIEAKMK